MRKRLAKKLGLLKSKDVTSLSPKELVERLDPLKVLQKVLPKDTPAKNSGERVVLCIWNSLQTTPATCYGNANHPGNYEIRVCSNAAQERDQLLAAGRKAIVYHF